MLKIYDYRCIAGHVNEHMSRDPSNSIRCPDCGAASARLISPVRCQLDYTFPGESIKWAKKHEEAAKTG